MKKRFFAALLAALTALTAIVAVPVGAATYGDWKYQITGGNVTITDYTGSDTNVTIPDTIDGCPVTAIGVLALEGHPSLTSVTIPDSVTSIGWGAFSDCSSLTSITIPDSVTAIGSYAFYGCSALASVTIGDSVTTIGFRAFCSCSALSEITVAGDNPNYVSIDGVLYDKSVSTLITCPDAKTSITIPDSVTAIGCDAFDNCSALTSITIPKGVTEIGDWAFSDCSSLTSITIPDSVTAVGDWAFAWCSALTSITIPDSVTTIGDDAFHGCRSLTSVTIPDSVITIGVWAFRGCSALSEITVNVENPNYASIDGVLYDKSVSKLIRCPNPKTSITIPDSVTMIGNSAFEGCFALTSVTIPDSVTAIGDLAFYGCSLLTEITVSGGNPNYVSIDGVLYDKSVSTLIACPGAKKSVTIPNSVTAIGWESFVGCSALTSITIPDSVTSIGIMAFEYCSALNTVCYGGSGKDWSRIQIDLFNDDLLNANIIFNPAAIPGDADGDGKVNAVDIQQIMRYLVGYDVDMNTDNADYNGDGRINNKDILMLLIDIVNGVVG